VYPRRPVPPYLKGVQLRLPRKVVGLGVLPAALVAIGIGSAQAATAPLHYAGACTAHGQFATCVAGGTDTRPATLYVTARTHNHQRLTVFWDVVCSKGLSAGSKSGQFTARSPIVLHVLKHPYRHPDSCIVSADAQISTGNYLHIQLSYRR
jgi:hypothetical protein